MKTSQVYRSVLFAIFGTFAWITLTMARPAAALPQYAQKEGKPCAYCHLAPQGGGPRTYRGVYYALHSHSFAFFDDKGEAAKAGVPIGPEALPPPKSYLAPNPRVPTVLTAIPSPEIKAPIPLGPTAISRAALAVEAARATYRKQPTLERKRDFAQALAVLGKAIWETAPSPAPQRYADARHCYLRALALDSTSTFAADEDQKLVVIGRSMGIGAPVPVPPGTVFVQDGEYVLALLAKPAPLRPNTLEVRVTHTGTNAPVPGLKVTSEQRMPGMADMGVAYPAAEETGDGNYRLPLAFTMMGVWHVRLTGQAPDGTRVETSLDFDVGGITWKEPAPSGFRLSATATNSVNIAK